MPQIFDVTANENARYKRNELEFKFGYCINFKYWTLLVSGTDLRTDGQTNGQKDDPITRCRRRTFQARGIKRIIPFTSYDNAGLR